MLFTMGVQMMLCSFVIPVFNEAESLNELYRQVVQNALLSKWCNEPIKYEIIFVNDGSSDDSVEIIHKLHDNDDNVHLISFRKNFGKSAALQAGFRNVSGGIVITMDSDLQDDPAEIPNMISKLEEGYDLVSGWKFNRQDPAEKKLPSKLFNAVTSYMSGIKLHDFDCCFKAYRREVIDAIDVYGELHRYLPVLAYRQGFSNITEIKVNHKKRQFGHSKYGFRRYFHGLFDAITTNFLLKYCDSPMYFFGKWGMIFGALGLLICVWMSVLHFMGQAIGSRPALFLGVLFILVGFQLFSTGIIGEMMIDSHARESYNENRVKEKF
ncbi:glycosyltransferase family 2 protein [Simiaoa sunii]|jgi:glycosyltransferase involved in cell wall biosynthesis|nr:glycosyltransferase family 2 protein [Simiaoa sunii]CDA98371.1 glycosyl transferase [Firmicutes bacterium CAG:65]